MTDATFTGSSFGGGWIVPHTDDGRDFLEGFFNDVPAPLMPLGGEEGYIVEPYEVADLAEQARDYGLSVEVE